MMMQTEREDVVSKEISGIRLTVNYDPVDCGDKPLQLHRIQWKLCYGYASFLYISVNVVQPSSHL